MPTLPSHEIAALLQPFATPSVQTIEQLSAYLDLLVKWNARTNLTAIRDPREMVARHFGESLFAAQHLGECPDLLDLGSGAGFPGLPIALLHPETAVTLAESQNKKSAFLREAVRTLGLSNVQVWANRAEAMPADRAFHTVAMRAVDNMDAALAAAAPLATHQLLILTTTPVPALPQGFIAEGTFPISGSRSGVVLRAGKN